MKRLAAIALLAAGCGGAHPGVEKIPAAPPADRSHLPAPGPAPDWQPPVPERWTLSNGVDVWYLQEKQTPLVSLRLVLPRGSATDPQGQSGLTALAADMLDEGAGGRTSLQINEELQRLATDYDANVDVDSTVLAMDMLADKFEPSVKMLADIVRRPEFPADEFERRKAQHLAGMIAAEADPGFGRGVTLRHVLFGDGYGSEMPTGTRDSIPKIDLAAVKAQYSRVVVPKGASFVIVGDVDRKTVDSVLGAAFGDWKADTDLKPAAVADVKPTHAIYLIDYPGTSQSAVAVARRAPGMVKAEDYFPARVFNWVLGGSFTSRLNLNLREDKGFTYGASSGFMRWRDAGFYFLGANVKAEATRDSIKEMLAEITNAGATKPLTKDEREAAIGGLLLGLPGDFERLDEVAGKFSDLPVFDRPADWYSHFPDRIRAVTLDEAEAVAKKYGDPNDFVIVVAGDRKSIEPSLAELGLPIQHFDAQGKPVQ
jgi:zinc protease